MYSHQCAILYEISKYLTNFILAQNISKCEGTELEAILNKQNIKQLELRQRTYYIRCLSHLKELYCHKKCGLYAAILQIEIYNNDKYIKNIEQICEFINFNINVCSIYEFTYMVDDLKHLLLQLNSAIVKSKVNIANGNKLYNRYTEIIKDIRTKIRQSCDDEPAEIGTIIKMSEYNIKQKLKQHNYIMNITLTDDLKCGTAIDCLYTFDTDRKKEHDILSIVYAVISTSHNKFDGDADEYIKKTLIFHVNF